MEQNHIHAMSHNQGKQDRVTKAGVPNDVPLVRIMTCGQFVVEVLREVRYDDSGTRTVIYEQPVIPRNGGNTALNLLKLLVSRPGYFANKDWLTEKLYSGKKQEDNDGNISGGLVRLDNVVSLLRSLLCPKDFHGEKLMRKRLLEYIAPTPESGGGYRLSSLPFVWIDVDALGFHMKQACYLETGEKDSLIEWQAAYHICSRGSFLPEALYSDWSMERREEVEGQHWQCVQSLIRIAVARKGETGQEEALRLLRDYWLWHQSNEDALCLLIELLCKRGDYQRAQQYYERYCELLQLEGRIPGKRVQHVIVDRQQSQHENMFASTEVAKLYHHKFEGHKQKEHIDADRREASKQLGFLGITLLTAPHRLFEPSLFKRAHINRDTLSLFMTLIETCLKLSEGSQLTTAERVLWSYLPEVESFAQKTSEHQQFAANMASQGYLIAASLVGHRNDLQTRQHFSEQAWYYGTLAQNQDLQVAALRQLAVTFDYLEQPQKVMLTYQQALPLLPKVSPRLRACVYAALSGVHAQFQQKHEATRFINLAYEHFPAKNDHEPNFLRLVNANYHTLVLWDGLNHLEFNQPKQAETIFGQLDVQEPKPHLPERIRIEFLNYRAKAFAAVNEMEQACSYLELAVHASIELQSQRRLQESFSVFQLLRTRWSHEQRVQQLGDLFFHTLLNHTQ